jgi:TPR repeat protein
LRKLADIYEKGLDVPKNESEAAKSRERAKERED